VQVRCGPEDDRETARRCRAYFRKQRVYSAAGPRVQRPTDFEQPLEARRRRQTGRRLPLLRFGCFFRHSRPLDPGCEARDAPRGTWPATHSLSACFPRSTTQRGRERACGEWQLSGRPSNPMYGSFWAVSCPFGLRSVTSDKDSGGKPALLLALSARMPRGGSAAEPS
jgi:hypothetical protein